MPEQLLSTQVDFRRYAREGFGANYANILVRAILCQLPHVESSYSNNQPWRLRCCIQKHNMYTSQSFLPAAETVAATFDSCSGDLAYISCFPLSMSSAYSSSSLLSVIMRNITGWFG